MLLRRLFLQLSVVIVTLPLRRVDVLTDTHLYIVHLHNCCRSLTSVRPLSIFWRLDAEIDAHAGELATRGDAFGSRHRQVATAGDRLSAAKGSVDDRRRPTVERAVSPPREGRLRRPATLRCGVTRG